MYSQLDPKWKSKKIGASSLSIGSYGCTLTCIAELSERAKKPFTPAQLASDKTCFTPDGLVLWNKVFAKIGGVAKYERRYGSMLPKVEADQSLILQVSIKSTYGKHWVVYKDAKTILDPLGGKERPLNYYPKITGYVLITWERTPESKLIKAKGSPAVYIYTGKKKFPIPDWDTLLFLFGEKAYIREMTEQEIVKIPTGELLPSLK